MVPTIPSESIGGSADWCYPLKDATSITASHYLRVIYVLAQLCVTHFFSDWAKVVGSFMGSPFLSFAPNPDERAIRALETIGLHHAQTHIAVSAIANTLGINDEQASQVLIDLIHIKKRIRLEQEFPVNEKIATGQARISRFQWVRTTPDK